MYNEPTNFIAIINLNAIFANFWLYFNEEQTYFLKYMETKYFLIEF